MTDLATVWTGVQEAHPQILGQISPERSLAMAKKALQDAAQEARRQAQRGAPRRHREDLGWQDLMAVCRWLMDYSDSLSLETNHRRN